MESTVVIVNLLIPVSNKNTGEDNRALEIADRLNVSIEVAKTHLEAILGSVEDNEQALEEFDTYPMAIDLKDIKRIGVFYLYDSNMEEAELSRIFLKDGSVYNVDIDFNLLIQTWLKAVHKTETYYDLRINVNNDEQGK